MAAKAEAGGLVVFVGQTASSLQTAVLSTQNVVERRGHTGKH